MQEFPKSINKLLTHLNYKSMKTKQINQVLENFANSKNNLIEFNDRTNEPDLTIRNFSYNDISCLKDSIFRLSRLALLDAVTDCDNNKKDEVIYDVLALLNLGQKLSLDEETMFIDELQENFKKKVVSEVDKTEKIKIWLSDENAVDPSNRNKNKIEQE